MPILHSRAIHDEHKQYGQRLGRLLNRKLNQINKRDNVSFQFYKMSYSAFVLVTELVRRTRFSVYLRELRSEIVSLIALGTLGFETSLHLRRCIELTLKHIYYCDHPIEYAITVESNDQKDDVTTRCLFNYVRRHPLMREARELGDPISCLENTYIRLCEVVHARGIVLPSKLVQCTLPKRSDSQILKEKQLYRDVMRNVVLLLMIYHKEKVHRFNALKKEASLYSLPHSIMQTVRAHLGI